MNSRWTMIGIAALSGAAMGTLWLPTGLAPLFPLAIALAMYGLRMADTGKKALMFGLVFGIVRYAVASHFLFALLRYSPLAIVFYFLAIAYILPSAALESWGAVYLEKKFCLPRSIGFGLLYTLLEWIRTFGDLSFPADSLAHAFGTAPSWLAWSSWSGPFGITLLIVIVGMILDAAWHRRRQLRIAMALGLGAVVLWMGPLITDYLREPEAETVGLNIGVVQPAISVQDKFERSRRPQVWERLERLTRTASRGADLVIWPESARPGTLLLESGLPFMDPRMKSISEQVGVPILYGCEIAWLKNGKLDALYNGAAIVYPDERPGVWYGKQHLLPFVEGIPFARELGLDSQAGSGVKKQGSYLTMMGKFQPGQGPVVFEVGSARIGVLICYEGMYPELGRMYLNAGANVLLLLTNDAWWGRSAFAPWHARMMTSRCRELRLPVIRAANSGISTATDRYGHIYATTALLEEATMTVSLHPSNAGMTLYARVGNWSMLASIGFILAWISVIRARRLITRKRS